MTTPLSANFLEAIGDAPVGVAVSGGGDSMALLMLLLDANVTVQVATVHHHLRAEASAEAAAVASFCASRNVPHGVLDWHWDGAGNLHDQARRARYELLASWAKEHELNHVALGHTADDNIETFVMGLSRGAGLDGLSGMRSHFMQDGVKFHRPLLDANRDLLREILRNAGVSWTDDPSNDDPTYHRVRIRQALVALKDAGVMPDSIDKSLSNLSQTRSDVTRELARALEGRFELSHGDLLLDLLWLQQSTLETRRRVLRAAIRLIAGHDYPPRGDKLMRLAALKKKSVLHGCIFNCDDAQLRISREPAAVSKAICSSDCVWDNRWVANGPHSADTELRALGEAGIAACPDGWRGLGLPRTSVLASPSVWEGATLQSAPHAGWPNGWDVTLRDGTPDLNSSVLLH